MHMNYRKIIGLITLSAFLCSLTACSGTPKDAPAETSAATSAAAPSETAGAESVTEALTAEATWFGRGVYAGQRDGITEIYYVFNDAANGSTSDPVMGIGLPFTCEQGADQVLFHMVSDENNTVMHMTRDAEGNVTGTLDEDTFTFVPVPGADPDTFDPLDLNAEETAAESPEAEVPSTESEFVEDPFAGTYIEEVAGRGVITVTPGTDNTYSVYIRWSGSASDYSEWEFSGEFNGRGVLKYTNCVKKHSVFTSEEAEEPETTTEYTDGSGYLQMSQPDGEKTGVIWVDDKEDAGAGCFFARG